MQYWLIKAVLILGLLGVTYFLVRPVRTASSLALRRIGMLLLILAAVFAIIFPEIFNVFARSIGVYSGTNLLVYLLVIALFAQMASGYRRDMQTNRKLTELARQVALQSAVKSEGTPNVGQQGTSQGVEDSSEDPERS